MVRTPHGAVRGRYEHGVAVFRGIPYAAPPFGPRRFRPPVPPEPWDGVRDATAFGPTAPKPPYSESFAQYLSDPVVPGDDCLNLNVWTPDPGARLPVMVWLHGGALTRGSSAVPVYDGRPFARDGVVLVSVNYRLGVEGYGLFPDAPANPGLRDQLAALQWVHESITAFGGDPDRVTLAGQSAGAISAGALLAAPQAQGLVRRAILQSGPPEAAERDKVRRVVRRMANRLKIPATAAAFADVDRELLLRTQAEVGKLSSPVLGGPAFGVVIDGDLVPRDPLEALADGDAAPDVDLLMGWTSDEYRLWLVPGGLLERVDRLGAVALAGAMARCHTGPEIPRGYRALHPDAGTAEIVGQMVADHLLRRPLQRLADARPGSSYLYEFAWPSNLPDLGACHALELGFVFDTGDVPESAKLAGENAPAELADAMHGAWVRFVESGDPGWEVWDAAHPVRIFGAGGLDTADAGRTVGGRLDTADRARTVGSGLDTADIARADDSRLNTVRTGHTVDGRPDTAHTAYGPRDAEIALWTATAPDLTPQESTPASAPPDGSPTRGTELTSVVRRLRLPGAVRRH
ncbi:carboxylesterase [Streptomyces dysideae]|uniref:Carboxylic ester hydrolase n=1 Tax=Streptomyces dysideae TaxID=909626 RepID=A0A124IES4_9ACTN|nr:carboxylesterase [Streptomyces dysideae]